MPAKKKTSKKVTKAKKRNRKKMATKKAAKRKPAKRQTAKRKTAPKGRATARNTRAIPITSSSSKRSSLGKDAIVDTAPFVPKGLGARSGGQSGDLQGLSNLESADSESVDELLEEGNAFEAEVVKGVEDAGDADEGEVHTHETPENPKDYKK